MSEEMSSSMTSPQVESVAPATTETSVNEQSNPVSTVDNTSQPTETFRVKYNHEEKEIPVDEARNLVQKGMNYEKAIERAKAEAYQASRDAYIYEQGYEWKGKRIETESEYNQAVKEYKIYQNLQSQSLPDEFIQEIIDGRRFREELMKERQTLEQKQKQDAEFKEFFDYFAAENGRSLDPERDSIPDEVWHATHKGKQLLDAYQANEAKTYKSKIKELESRLNIQKANEQNAATSAGSVTGNGNGNEGSYISYDTFEANRHDRNWINKNYKKILDSRSKW